MGYNAVLPALLAAAALTAGVAKADDNVIGEIGGFDTGRNIGNIVFPTGDVHPSPGDEFLASTNTSPYVTFVVSNKGDRLGYIPSTFLTAAANATIVKDADGDGLDDIAIGGKILKYDGTEIATLHDGPVVGQMTSATIDGSNYYALDGGRDIGLHLFSPDYS